MNVALEKPSGSQAFSLHGTIKKREYAQGKREVGKELKRERSKCERQGA